MIGIVDPLDAKPVIPPKSRPDWACTSPWLVAVELIRRAVAAARLVELYATLRTAATSRPRPTDPDSVKAGPVNPDSPRRWPGDLDADVIPLALPAGFQGHGGWLRGECMATCTPGPVRVGHSAPVGVRGMPGCTPAGSRIAPRLRIAILEPRPARCRLSWRIGSSPSARIATGRRAEP